MFKQDLEKAEEPEFKLPTSAGLLKKQESSRKTSISASLTTPKPLTVWFTTNGKILKEMGIPDHLICLLRNLYAGQEAAVRTGHGTMGWFQIGKGVCQGCILSPVYLIYMQSTSCKMPGCMQHKLGGNKIAGRNSDNLRYADDITLVAESKELESHEESERGGRKSWLKAQHSKNEDQGIWAHHFMANRWGNNGNSDSRYFLRFQKSLQMVTAAMKLKDVYSLEEKL